MAIIGAIASVVACTPAEEVTGWGWPGVAPNVVRRGPEPALPDFDAGAAKGDATVSACSSTCPVGACQPGVGCCPAGSAWHDALSQCVSTGPTGCDVSTPAKAAACVPSWCQRWQDAAGADCNAGSTGCWLVGRPCAVADGATSTCKAGSVRSPAGACVLAGSEIEVPVGQALTWASQEPARLVPPSPTTKVAPMGVAAPPQWCPKSGGDEPAPCGVGDSGCAPGEVVSGAACVAVGQVSICPNGFTASSNAPAPGELATCLPATSCGSGTWGDIEDTPDTLYVQSGAATGGDGSKAKPFHVLDLAVAAAAKAGKPTTIALAKGEYKGGLDLEGELTLRGVCAANVRLKATVGQSNVDIRGAKTAVELRDLTLEGGDEGIRVTNSAKATVSRLWVVAAESTGIRLDESAQLTANALLVDGMALPALPMGRGIRIDEGASATLTDMRIHGTRDRALYVSDAGSSVSGSKWLISGTRGRASDDKYGRGIQVGGGALIQATDIRVHGNRTTGVLLDEAAKGSRLARLLIEGTLAQASDSGHGEGLVVRDSPQVELVGVHARNNRTVGLALEGTTTNASLLNAAVADTLPRQSDGQRGTGLNIEGAQVSLGWLHIANNRRMGIEVDGGAKVAGLYILVTGTRAEGDGTDGRGIGVSGGASVTLSWTRLTDNRDVGLRLSGTGTLANLEDVFVDHTGPRASDGNYGRGIYVSSGARLVLDRGRLSNNRDAGLYVSGADSSADVHTLQVDGTRPRAADNRRGHGVVASSGASVKLSDVRCSANHNVGLLVAGKGTSATASKLVVDGTFGASITDPEGYGVAVVGHAKLTLSSARLHHNEGVGLYAAGTQTVVSVTDMVVDDGQPLQGSDASGGGLAIEDGARLNLRRARLSANHDVGLMAEGTATTVNALDLIVDGTRLSPADNGGGRAINIERRASLHLRRAWLIDNRDVALYVSDHNTLVVAGDLWIANTANHKGGGFGDAVGVVDDANVTLAGLRLQDNAGSGVVVHGATAVVDGVSFSPGPQPGLEELVAGVQSIDDGDLTLRGALLDKPWRLGLAIGHAAATMSEVVVLSPAWVGPAPDPRKEAASAADGMANHKSHVTLTRSLILSSDRASGTQTNALTAKLVRSAFLGGRYGLVVRSGNKPDLEGSVVAGQEGIDPNLAMKLDVLVDALKASGRPGLPSP